MNISNFEYTKMAINDCSNLTENVTDLSFRAAFIPECLSDENQMIGRSLLTGPGDSVLDEKTLLDVAASMLVQRNAQLAGTSFEMKTTEDIVIGVWKVAFVFLNLLASDDAEDVERKILEMDLADFTRYGEAIRLPVHAPGPISLSEHFAFCLDLMRSRLPLAYLIDDFSTLGIGVESLDNLNEYWWAQREGKGDVVIDRHGNTLSISQLPKVSASEHRGALNG